MGNELHNKDPRLWPTLSGHKLEDIKAEKKRLSERKVHLAATDRRETTCKYILVNNLNTIEHNKILT